MQTDIPRQTLSQDKSRDPTRLRARADEIAALVPKLMMAAHHAAASVMAGEHALKKVGQGQNFWQFREYDTHDRPQDIDWRQSAKSDRVYVREKEHQSAQTLLLWADGHPGMHWRSDEALPTKRRIAETIILSLSIIAIHNGEMFKQFREDAKTGRTDKAVEKMALHLLEYATDDPDLSSLGSIRWTRRSLPILVGDFLDPIETLSKTLSRLVERAANGVVVQVLDPAELDLPYQGRVRFSGINGEEELIENISSIRAEYQEKINAHRAHVKAEVERNGWHFFEITTNSHLAPLVQDIWRLIADLLQGEKRS